MVAKKSSDWLPAGWSVEHKVQKNGRKAEYYTNSETGQKFYSKNDVVRYLNMGSIHCNPPQSMDSQLSNPPQSIGSQLSKRSRKEHSQVVVKANEFPEWLPEGWIMELKTKQSGSKIGKQYKCYVDPSTGHKFYSKPEVFRHLNSVKHGSCSSKQEDFTVGEHSTENVVMKANESPEWLPKDWIVELKTHKSGSKIGKKFKYYVDPSTGRKFLSKPQVFQYLESVKSGSCSFKQKDLGADVDSTKIFQTDHSAESGDTPKQNVLGHAKDMKQNISSCKQKKTHVGIPARNVSTKKVVPEGLPPGWVLEIKIKGKRRDPYYTDPVSGYVFRSRKDVFRYLETGEVSRHAFKPKNRSINDSETITNGIVPPSAAKMQELSDRATRRQLFAGNGNSEVSSLAWPNAEYPIISRVTRASSNTKLPNVEGTSISRVTRASSKTKLPDAEGTSISRVTRASSKTRLVAAPITESIQEKHPLRHTIAGKGSSEVTILELPSAEGTSIRRVTRASAKTNLVAAPTTESLQERLPLKHTTAVKGSSEVSNLALPNTKGTSTRRASRGSAKTVLVSAPTNEGLQEKHPLDHIASGKESSEMSSVALPNVEGTILRRVTRGSTKTKLVSAPTTENLQKKNLLDNAFNKCVQTSKISDPSGSTSPEANDLKRKRGQRVSARTKHVSTPAADIVQEKELVEYTTEKCAKAKENPAKGSNRKQGKKGSAEIGSVSVPTDDMSEEGKLLKNGLEKHINQRTRKNSSNIKNHKELNLTRRSSKRLAGLGSELAVDLQAAQVAAAKDNTEDILALNFVVDSVAQWASQPLETNPEFADKASVGPGNPFDEEPSYKSYMVPEDQTNPKEHLGNLEAEKKDKGNQEFAHKASVGTGDSLDVRPSNKSNMLPEDRTAPKEHVEYSEVEKKDEGNPESQPSFAFDSWPDPCLEFAFKTLTEDNPDVGGYCPQQTGMSHSQRDGGLGVPKLGLPNAFETNGSSHCDAPVIPVSGALPIQDNLNIQGYFQQQSDTTQIQRDGGLGVPELGLPNAFEINGSSHCDAHVIPVSGALPIQDNLNIQGYFQQQSDTTHILRDGSLGEPEFPITFQIDGSSHCDAPVIPVLGQQLLVNPSFMPSSNVSLPSCNEIGPQQPSMEENNNNHRQVH